jgi:PIN domain nuclease of toxin-antitoxin system
MNGYLLDSHVWVWSQSRPENLSQSVHALLSDRSQRVYLSVVSPWELLIKHKKRPVPGFSTVLNGGPQRIRAALAASDIALIGIELDDVALAPALPLPQSDPFDRLIVAQAQLRKLRIITNDRKMLGYSKVEFLRA